MKLEQLSISNFKALKALTISNLKSGVVLAGPNGCGKSCVLDAIRLLKSAYGSYHQDEWQQWLTEFQLSLKGGRTGLGPLFHDKKREIKFSADFTISSEERAYRSANAESLLTEVTWRTRNGGNPMQLDPVSGHSQTPNRRADRERVQADVARSLPEIESELAKSRFSAEVVIEPGGRVLVSPNPLLELLLSTYQPDHLGVIDYHGPHRAFGREQLSSINLTIDSENKLRQHALYNYNNKYSNVKTEIAAAYLRHLIAKEANPAATSDDSLTETLKELFSTFFPGKQFVGPVAATDGTLQFPVRLDGGGEHEIDSLSSGEKEVLYGYLRLHNTRPRHSIIMIDEPELHLNPRLIAGLAPFYYRHLAKALGNQLWLVTHSDTLIRDAVASKDFSVIHVQPSALTDENQATPVAGRDELEGLVIELVGDLAAYRPGAKIVVFESTEEAGFDQRMTCALFPEFALRVNSISGGNKRRVTDLYELLERASQQGYIPAKFFAIVDSDDETEVAGPASRLRWDRYHIENYLLESSFILEAMKAIGEQHERFSDEIAVSQALVECAKKTVPLLVKHKLRVHVNSAILSCLNLNSDPKSATSAADIANAAQRSHERMGNRLGADLSATELSRMATNLESSYSEALSCNGWKKRFRGRDVLKRFVGDHLTGIAYEPFRELIITRMKDAGFKPEGMRQVVEAVLR
ncbi:MAG TPA: AAA family ATPase [Tepidisphaeraceae bacterium]|nr:AAA family ATPase [Tepidisphaeraceae bacterium]